MCTQNFKKIILDSGKYMANQEGPDQSAHTLWLRSGASMCGSRGGDRGSGTPLKNHKNIVFLSNICQDPL